MRGDYVLGDEVYCWRSGGGVHQSQSHWMGTARVVGVDSSNLRVSHRMASPAEKEMREMVKRLGSEDSDSRKGHAPSPRQQDLTRQQPPTTETAKSTLSKEPQQQQHATEQQPPQQATEQQQTQ